MTEQWKVMPENREKFENVVRTWGMLVQVLGWDTLADMYISRVPPFQDVKPLYGSAKNKRKRARQILLNNLALEMKEAGLEIHHGK